MILTGTTKTVEEIKTELTNQGGEPQGQRELEEIKLALLLNIADSLEKLVAKP